MAHGQLNREFLPTLTYGLKPDVWVRVGPDLQAELQFDPTRGLQAQEVDLVFSQFLLHYTNRRTAIHLAYPFMVNWDIINRLAVCQSARAHKTHKVNNRINRLMDLHKTETDRQKIGPVDHTPKQSTNWQLAVYIVVNVTSRTRLQTDRHRDNVQRLVWPGSQNLCQTMKIGPSLGRAGSHSFTFLTPCQIKTVPGVCMDPTQLD